MDVKSVVQDWPEQSKQAAQMEIEKRGEPDEVTESMLIWHDVGPWKRVEATKEYSEHNFPKPHTDSVESFLQYSVPPEKFSDLARFDGSVVANRTRGEISARCHDEEANFLALNLAHDIITGEKSVAEAREYYAHEMLAFRRKEPTPYMEGLKFEPQGGPDTDERIISDAELKLAKEVGEGSRQAANV